MLYEYKDYNISLMSISIVSRFDDNARVNGNNGNKNTSLCLKRNR